MPGLVPGIHVFTCFSETTWMAGWSHDHGWFGVL